MRSKADETLVIVLTEFAPHHTKAKSAGWCSGKRHCYQYGHGQIQGECTPRQPFSNMLFDEYSFSIISNLFDNYEPYALSKHNRKCMNKMHYI